MSSAEAPAAAPERKRWGESRLWSFFELAVLWTFAVAQPLFDLLKDNPEFFAARGSSGLDVISFAVLLVLVPPLLLVGVELLIGLAGARARHGTHLVFLAALVALIAAQALKRAFDASDLLLIGLSLAIGGGVAGLYAAADPVRSFLRVLSPAPLVFLALFLFTDPISKVAFPDEAQARTIGGVARAPIVMVVFDELPTNTLVDDRGRIDPERYPGFAELARDATWFKNAYTVYDSTERAQPAIMDGNLPTEDGLPTSSDHPNSLFSLFGKTHRMLVSEEATTVCSREICSDERLDEGYARRIQGMGEDLGLVWLHVVSPPDMEADLPSVSENWGNFAGAEETPYLGDPAVRNAKANLNAGRQARFEDWIESIRDGPRPQLAFKHTLLPHVPWQYLPDERRYRRAPNDVVPGLSNLAYRWQSQLDVLLQRHFLQTGFADRELALLLSHLKEQGLYDKSLIVVAADHGVSFPKRRQRRRIGRKTAAEIAPVPLLIKAPEQNRGEIDDAWVSTIDILPTIFDVLELDAKVEMDGSSAFSDEVQNRSELRMLIRDSFDELNIPAAEFERERQAIIDRNLRLFGSGRDDRLYRIGPNPELIGTDAAAAGLTKLEVELPYAPDYRDVDTGSGFVPAHVVARVQGGGEGGREIAVAVNGKIAAVGETFTLATGAEGELVSVMVPPESFEQGRNVVEVFEP